MNGTVAEVLEAICRDLQAEVGDADLTRAEIVQRVVQASGCDPGSVLPSDHCHNRTNRGVRRSHLPFLLHVGEERSGRYRYVGRHYLHQGPVDHYPQEGGYVQLADRDDC